MTKATFNRTLADGMNDFQKKLWSSQADRCRKSFEAWCRRKEIRSATAFTEDSFSAFLQEIIPVTFDHLLNMHSQHEVFLKQTALAKSDAEKKLLLIDYSRSLGSNSSQIRQDKKAFARWFGEDAIIDRYMSFVGKEEKYLCYLLGQVEGWSNSKMSSIDPSDSFVRLVKVYENVLSPILNYQGDSRVVSQAFKTLCRLLTLIGDKDAESRVEPRTLRLVYSAAMLRESNVWLQCEALNLIRQISPNSFQKVAENRMRNPGDGDDFFVRARLVHALGEALSGSPHLTELLACVRSDPSIHVRQALTQTLARLTSKPFPEWLKVLACEDPSPVVRATAVTESLVWLKHPPFHTCTQDLLLDRIQNDSDAFVVLAALHSYEQAYGILDPQTAMHATWATKGTELLSQIHLQHSSTKIRRRAAQVREVLWSESSEQLRTLKSVCQTAYRKLKRQGSFRLLKADLPGVNAGHLARIMSVVAQTTFGCHILEGRKHFRMVKGDIFGFRWWRFLHEIRRSAPEKRQAFRHTIGRHFQGYYYVPSSVLNELAKTNVPGEPLFIPEEISGRTYLPLPDQVVEQLSLFRSKPYHITSAEGTVMLRPPGLWKRMISFIGCSWKFSKLADLRNWKEQSRSNPSAYVQEIRKLGVGVELIPHKNLEGGSFKIDPRVERFFQSARLLPFGGPWIDEFWQYSFSLYENSLTDLFLFTLATCALFAGWHMLANRRLASNRRKLPLVIGGWGTRGKSGTERLKAAVFNGLGHGIVSKTTGCEAMFLHAFDFGELKEMFLFRPYDKASIWEQGNVVRIAAGFHADVFLWECMGLTPAYVEILQQKWMKDDLSTITNTYPDHEDLQGPAGINIPEVMTCFIPRNSHLLTTEDQMYPILQEAAEGRQTSFSHTGWLQAGLISPEILQRFPYDEHPFNIALVTDLCMKCGIERDFALKEMADHVVPDLGVLKTFPTAVVNDRSLQFINGMSANERHGCLGNWVRTGLDSQSLVDEPGTWISVVVNNRADRVPRSRVFARIMVNDISADRYYLIGGNLDGLQSYIEEEWNVYEKTLNLWPDVQGSDPVSPSVILEQTAIAARMPVFDGVIQKQLGIMTGGSFAMHELQDLNTRKDTLPHGERVEDYYELANDFLRRYQSLQQELTSSGDFDCDVINQKFQLLMREWFFSRIRVMEDYYASGDKLVDWIANDTPPGFFNRVMGIQNIKGTGLDFVYRWEAWSACSKLCEHMHSQKESEIIDASQKLAGFQEFGLLSERLVTDTLQWAREQPFISNTLIEASLSKVQTNFQQQMQTVRNQFGSKTDSTGALRSRCFQFLEGLLDIFAAVWRRRKADAIYNDLIEQRISRNRAVKELQLLTKHQKGGWLESLFKK